MQVLPLLFAGETGATTTVLNMIIQTAPHHRHHHHHPATVDLVEGEIPVGSVTIHRRLTAVAGLAAAGLAAEGLMAALVWARVVSEVVVVVMSFLETTLMSVHVKVIGCAQIPRK